MLLRVSISNSSEEWRQEKLTAKAPNPCESIHFRKSWENSPFKWLGNKYNNGRHTSCDQAQPRQLLGKLLQYLGIEVGSRSVACGGVARAGVGCNLLDTYCRYTTRVL